MDRPEVTSREKVAQQKPLDWRLGMEREVHQTDVDGKVPPQLLNTPGTEVAPGSNVVCEHFEDGSTIHGLIVREEG
jgi:hypothetical protein